MFACRLLEVLNDNGVLRSRVQRHRELRSGESSNDHATSFGLLEAQCRLAASC